MSHLTLESEYLIKLIKCAINEEDFVKPPENIDLNKLFKLAVSQQVYSIVVSTLEKNGILNEQQMKKWKIAHMSEMQKILTMNVERENILNILEESEVDYMPLKGLIVREYYPKASMRQMSDNDIMYHEKDRNTLVKIMKNCGYHLDASAGISDDFKKEPFCSFEWHRTLFNPEEDFCPEFNPWKRAKLKEGTKHYYIMNAEDNYIYTVSHLYKHYHCIDGCGIRFLCDIYLLWKKDNLDFDYIDSTFSDFGILNFADTALKLAVGIFDDKKIDGEEKDLLEFMLSGGVYGKSSFSIEEEIEKKGGSKAGYLLYRLFPPVKMMVGNYRILEKHIYLLPLFYVVRIFEKFKYKRSKMVKELDMLKNKDKK